MVLILLVLVAIVLGFLLALTYWGALVVLRPVLAVFNKKRETVESIEPIVFRAPEPEKAATALGVAIADAFADSAGSPYLTDRMAFELTNTLQQSQIPVTIITGVPVVPAASIAILASLVANMTDLTSSVSRSSGRLANQVDTAISAAQITELKAQRAEGAAA